jgi:hypothetical protein
VIRFRREASFLSACLFASVLAKPLGPVLSGIQVVSCTEMRVPHGFNSGERWRLKLKLKPCDMLFENVNRSS